MTGRYLIPQATQRTQTSVANSRFITTIGRVNSVEDTKAFLAQIRAEMPDASHHVYAFRIGYGNSTIEGMSDDGEPTGTSGPPVLSVLRGSKVGDVMIVVTRYFGGTKLGTGGLVRAYTEAAQVALADLAIEEKIEKVLLGVEATYTFYGQIKRLVESYHGVLKEETFEADIIMVIEFPEVEVEAFSNALRDLTSGKITPVILS